jgi:hypothetical protein
MAKAANSDLIISKRKAINALLPYAIYLEQGRKQEMMDTILRVARASNSDHQNTGKFIWRRVVLYISRLFEEQSPASLDRVIALISPHVPWDGALNDKTAVVRWAAAATAIPYTDEVGSSVVDTLLQIAWVDLLRSHIPTKMWGWLKKRPPLPPMYDALTKGGYENIVAHVSGLKDIDTLKSYFILVWSERYAHDSDGIHAMKRSIREDFHGAEMGKHREDLIERLEHILGILDRRAEDDERHTVFQGQKKNYTKLRDALLEVGRR